MEQETIIGNRTFYFNKMSAVDALQTQQLLLQKLKLDQELMALFGSMTSEDDDGSGLYFMFVKLVQGFGGDELINFITDIIAKAHVKVMGDTGKTMVSINRDFKDNFNLVFKMVFDVLKANYDFDFFLQSAPMKQAKKNTVKVQPGKHQIPF